MAPRRGRPQRYEGDSLYQEELKQLELESQRLDNEMQRLANEAERAAQLAGVDNRKAWAIKEAYGAEIKKMELAKAQLQQAIDKIIFESPEATNLAAAAKQGGEVGGQDTAKVASTLAQMMGIGDAKTQDERDAWRTRELGKIEEESKQLISMREQAMKNWSAAAQALGRQPEQTDLVAVATGAASGQPPAAGQPMPNPAALPALEQNLADAQEAVKAIDTRLRELQPQVDQIMQPSQIGSIRWSRGEAPANPGGIFADALAKPGPGMPVPELPASVDLYEDMGQPGVDPVRPYYPLMGPREPAQSGPPPLDPNAGGDVLDKAGTNFDWAALFGRGAPGSVTGTNQWAAEVPGGGVPQPESSLGDQLMGAAGMPGKLLNDFSKGLMGLFGGGGESPSPPASSGQWPDLVPSHGDQIANDIGTTVGVGIKQATEPYTRSDSGTRETPDIVVPQAQQPDTDGFQMPDVASMIAESQALAPMQQQSQQQPVAQGGGNTTITNMLPMKGGEFIVPLGHASDWQNTPGAFFGPPATVSGAGTGNIAFDQELDRLQAEDQNAFMGGGPRQQMTPEQLQEWLKKAWEAFMGSSTNNRRIGGIGNGGYIPNSGGGW